jgi:hypothetical protein
MPEGGGRRGGARGQNQKSGDVDMSCADWHAVYREERRRPGYVLENGRSLIRRGKDAAWKREAKLPVQEKRKAA